MSVVEAALSGVMVTAAQTQTVLASKSFGKRPSWAKPAHRVPVQCTCPHPQLPRLQNGSDIDEPQPR